MSLPLVLCYLSEERGIPTSFKKLLGQYFNLLSVEEFEDNQKKYRHSIVAIFNFHGNPKVSVKIRL